MASENFLAQLKAVVDPLTIFGHYLSLKKSGNRFKALCPFHSEKTPSFYAASTGMFHCFGCGTGGDVITFVMNMEKLDFKECIQLLSSRYGVPIKFSSSGERKEREILLDLMRQATDFYHNLLTTHSSGKEPLEYLTSRGVAVETIKRFQLGWSPNSWNGLLEHFHKRDVEPALLEKCGLVVPRQNEGFYDRYRSRIMVPIHDIQGNIIAFGGRIFQGTGEEAKYMNSPETALYSKSNHLFGLYFSKDAVQQKKFAILVEGYFDMILPFQAGHSNIVASLGTALTENQTKLLRRYTEHVVLFYDPDTAGKNAVLRAIPLFLKENFVVDIANLPDGLDPDSFIRERGAEEFEQEIHKALRYDRLVLSSLEQKYDLKSSTGKLAASDELFALLDTISNPFERVSVIKKFATGIGVDPQYLHDHYKRRNKKPGPANSVARGKTLPEKERQILQVLLMDPAIARQLLPEIEDDDLQEFTNPDLFRTLREILSIEDPLSTAEVIHQMPSETQAFLTELVFKEVCPPPKIDSARDLLLELRRARKERLARQIDQRLEEARQTGDDDALNRLLIEKLELTRASKRTEPERK